MPSASQYHLRVTAGSSYTQNTPVSVNEDSPLKISTEKANVEILVRIKDFRAHSSASAPTDHSYFSDPHRSHARFSLGFAVTPKADINGNALLLGNDFDEPIRDFLPPFFGAGLSVVKRFIDPGIDGDPYGDKPYLFGPLVSSTNIMHVGEKDSQSSDVHVLEEGGKGDGKDLRHRVGMPDAAAARMKFFLDEEKRKMFNFEKGRVYDFDFFNGYLDFNDFTLKLPMGITFSVIPSLWKEKIPPLRYVLKDRDGTVLFHVTFTLVKNDDEEEDSTSKKNESPAPNAPEPSEDDLD